MKVTVRRLSLRVILTVVAVCLLWICVRNVSLMSTAVASGPEPGEVVDVRIVGIEHAPKLPWQPLDVRLSEIRKSRVHWDMVKVEVDRVR